jgi:hypothetical protein
MIGLWLVASPCAGIVANLGIEREGLTERAPITDGQMVAILSEFRLYEAAA